MKIEHIAMYVKDLEKTKTFFDEKNKDIFDEKTKTFLTIEPQSTYQNY